MNNSIPFDTPRKKPYGKLRGLFSQYDYRYEDIAPMLGCSRSYLNQAINGHTAWTLDVCYRLLDLFRIPHEQLNEYFPKDGKAA